MNGQSPPTLDRRESPVFFPKENTDKIGGGEGEMGEGITRWGIEPFTNNVKI